MRKLYKPIASFALKMTFWSTFSLLSVIFVLFIVARLDVAFFEANGMVRSPELRDAFYFQIFHIDSIFFAMLFLGMCAVVGVSVIFCKSQFDYMKRLANAFSNFADRSEIPSSTNLGQFNPHAIYFFDVIARRLNGEDEEKIRPVLDTALRVWPRAPRVSWVDQAQFAIVAGLMGAFFSTLCVLFYWKVTDRVVDLSNILVRYTSVSGPQFMTEQFTILNLVVFVVLTFTTVNFFLTGYRFGVQIAEANYAVLRDMRNFMEGNYKQRFHLRKGYPAAEFAIQINQSVDKIVTKLKERGVTDAETIVGEHVA